MLPYDIKEHNLVRNSSPSTTMVVLHRRLSMFAKEFGPQ